jgi:hypothetical protein
MSDSILCALKKIKQNCANYTQMNSKIGNLIMRWLEIYHSEAAKLKKFRDKGRSQI